MTMADFSTLPPNLQAAYARDPRRRQIQAMRSRSFNKGDITNPMQGLAQLLMAYKSGKAGKELEADYAKRGEDYSAGMSELLAGLQPGTETVPATGHPGLDQTPATTRNIPVDYGKMAKLAATLDPALGLQISGMGASQRAAGAERDRAAEALTEGRKYEEGQAETEFERAKELKGMVPDEPRRIVKGADGKNYYADTQEPVLRGVKTPSEQFMELIGDGPDDELGAGDELGGGAGADVLAPPADITSDETGDDALIGGTKQPSVREIFHALPAEVQTGIKMAKDPMKAFSSYMLRKKGLDITVDENGNIQISEGGSPYKYGKKGTGTIEERLFDTREGLARLQTIDESFRPEFLQVGTRFNAAWSGIKESFGVDLSPEDKAQLADYSTFKMTSIENINRYIKEITGAQMSEAEATRLRKGVPDPGDSWYNGDSPTEFQSKMTAQTRELRRAGARYTYALKNGWDMSPDNLENSLPLKKVEDLIEERGAALERQLRARRPGMSDSAIEGFVMRTLNDEFGMAQ